MAHEIENEIIVTRTRAYDKVVSAIEHYSYLPKNVGNLLLDQEILISRFMAETDDGFRGSYSDYSFLVAPVCKAFEGYLIFLAEKFDCDLNKVTQVGWHFSTKNDGELGSETLELLKKKMGEDKLGMTHWKALGATLILFRHSPMHYNGKIASPEKAQTVRGQLESSIESSLEYFVSKGYITEQNDDANPDNPWILLTRNSNRIHTTYKR